MEATENRTATTEQGRPALKNAAKLSMPSDRELVITRDFNAPRDLVFEAWSKPEHIRRWFVRPPDATLPVCEMDFRPGGTWRWVARYPQAGGDHAFSGEYREVVRPERLVFTERYEPIPDSDHLVTITFTEKGGKTALQEHILYKSAEHRDGHLRSGMEAGMQEALNRLEDVAASLRKA
ncbi:MAG TPA: SRPBCC family protein [Myxococcaceae bacterium]|nr:SRPBCC family protein [Myxococcaceae bacterium]